MNIVEDDRVKTRSSVFLPVSVFVLNHCGRSIFS
jgi:hypothetical protein